MPNERLTDAQIAIAARDWDGLPQQVAQELQSLRASERELRGMIAGLVESLELARRDLSQNGNYINATTMFIDRALTPAVRAVAEAAEKEKANAS